MRGSGDEINKRNRGVLPMEQMEKFVVRHIMCPFAFGSQINKFTPGG